MAFTLCPITQKREASLPVFFLTCGHSPLGDTPGYRFGSMGTSPNSRFYSHGERPPKCQANPSRVKTV